MPIATTKIRSLLSGERPCLRVRIAHRDCPKYARPPSGNAKRHLQSLAFIHDIRPLPQRNSTEGPCSTIYV